MRVAMKLFGIRGPKWKPLLLRLVAFPSLARSSKHAGIRMAFHI